MARKAITFIGRVPKTEQRPYGYDLKRYTYGAQACESPFVAEALVSFFQPDALYVISTTEALDYHLPDLAARLPPGLVLNRRDIPAPSSDASIWQIFRTITAEDVVGEGDTIIFDVTLGFRSIPILAMLADSYLRVVRNSTLEALTYAEVQPHLLEAPLRNLTTFVNLLDWTRATDAFIKYGRADDLHRQLGDPGTGLGSDVANTLTSLTAALQLSRPQEVMQTAVGLDATIEAALQQLGDHEQPFALLLRQIRQSYSQFGLDQPQAHARARDVLDRLLRMIDWYLEKGMALQAMTLAREWLVSLVVYYQGGDIFDDERRRTGLSDREIAEKIINVPSHKFYRQQGRDMLDIIRTPTERRPVEIAPATMVVLPAVRTLWRAVSAADLRNDLAHAGMRKQPRLAKVAQAEVTQICRQLRPLLPE